MEVGILGPLKVSRDGVEIPVTAARVRAVLALLTVRANENVTAERLADDLWGTSIPPGYANSLQSLVSRLRRTLGAAGTAIVTTPTGYRLDVEPAAVDAIAFTEAAGTGRRQLADGNPAAAAATLAHALSMWHGDTLQDVIDEGVLHREATRLEELRLAALEDRIDADLRCGRHLAVIPELSMLTATHPLRERLHGFSMLARYRAGRQADALRAFQEARKVLAEELGLDPGEELRALESSILDHDPALDLDLPVDPAPSGERPRTNLWRELSHFVGRSDDVVALGAALEGGRLVTVVGPGGAGKTRLAVEVAMPRIDREEVWFVDLAPLRSDDAVPGAVALVVGVADNAVTVNAPAGSRSVADRIAEHVADRQVLLLFDNCEHVIPGAARLAEQLLVACPRLRVLATSHEALGVRGELIWPLPPMTVEDAVLLFADRAANTGGFTLSADTEPTVVDLCTRLDGMPLAIELAAGRLRAIPVRQLAARLDDRFRLLTGGARTALPRQQTLRAVVEWSYELLFDDEQLVFDRLSVFAGGCSLEAAEAVCGGDDIAHEDVADLLAHLVDKSLVIAETIDETGEVRYRLLQTLELYGRERLAAGEGGEPVRARHAAYFTALAVRGHGAFRGTEDQESWIGEVERERENLRAALTWLTERDDALGVHRLVGGLAWTFWFSGRGEEGWRVLTGALRCPGTSTPEATAMVAMWAGYVGISTGTGIDAALRLGEEAIAALEAAPGGDDLDGVSSEILLADAYMLLAGTREMGGDRVGARALYVEATRRYAQLQDPWSRALAPNAAARLADNDGDIERAYELMTESLGLMEAAGIDWATAIIGGDASLLAVRLGRYEDAMARTDRALVAATRLRLDAYASVLLSRLGGFALAAGDVVLAERYAREGIELATRVRSLTTEGFGLACLSVVRRVQGRLDEAAEHALLAGARFEASGLRDQQAMSHSLYGFVAHQRGDVATTRRSHLRTLRLEGPRPYLPAIALAVEGLAGVALQEGDVERAAALLGVSAAARRAGGATLAGPYSIVAEVRQGVVERIGAAELERISATVTLESLDELLAVDEVRDLDAPASESRGDQAVVGELRKVLASER